MCKRRKRRKRHKRRPKKIRKDRTEAKKKRTCCQRCKRRIRKWLWRRFKRCFKKTVFGYPDPQLDDFEVGGYNLGSVRDKLRNRKSKDSFENVEEIDLEKKPTVVTLYRSKRKKSTKSIPMKDALINEFGRYSFSKSVKNFVEDLKERNIFLGLSKDSRLNLNETEKEKFRKLAEEYEKKNKSNAYINLMETSSKLRKKISLSASKSAVYRNMIEDIKKRKIALSKIMSKRNENINNFNKENLNKILDRYMSQKKESILENIILKDNKISMKQLDVLKNLNSSVLKDNLNLSNSKPQLLKAMADDIKKGKFSLSKVPSNIVNDKKKLKKEDVTKLLDYYKLQHEKKHYPFVKQSKIKQFKSDIMAKLDPWLQKI